MENLYELMEQACSYLQSGKKVPDNIIDNIKTDLTSDSCIGLAQIDTRIGDFEYNAKKIVSYITFGENIGLKTIVFPELSLSGTLMEDIISRHPMIVSENYKWLKVIAKFCTKTTAFVGYIENNDDKYYNSVAILGNGKIQKSICKSLINKNNNVDDYNNIKIETYGDIGIVIKNSNISDNIKRTNDKATKILIDCAALKTQMTKTLFKNNILPSLAKEYNLPVAFVNQISSGDNYLLDGLTCMYNSNGELAAATNYLKEQLLIVNPNHKAKKLSNIPNIYINLNKSCNKFSLDYENDMERIYNTLVFGTKEYFTKCGLKRAVLGLSGGLDSTVCAVILADAIGKENVYGISMPSYITSKESKSDARILAQNLGINFSEASIKPMIDSTNLCFNNLFKDIENHWGKYYDKSSKTFTNDKTHSYALYTQDNIQARSRAMYLWGVSNEFSSCIPIATSDKSEAYMGYATINGDMSGGFAPIADVTKTKLFALARWINKNRENKNAIPESIINKRPGAELAINPETGLPLKAEDALMPYEFLDEIIWRIENNNESYNDLLNTEFLYEKTNNVTKAQKIQWLDKFYHRMSGALYKWTIMPPSIPIDIHSINRCEYSQPITSGRINYKEADEDFISKVLLLN